MKHGRVRLISAALFAEEFHLKKFVQAKALQLAKDTGTIAAGDQPQAIPPQVKRLEHAAGGRDKFRGMTPVMLPPEAVGAGPIFSGDTHFLVNEGPVGGIDSLETGFV